LQKCLPTFLSLFLRLLQLEVKWNILGSYDGSSTSMPRFGGRFQLNAKANSTTAATAFTLFTPSINYADMPALVSSSSEDGDM
jgi:hypothetical protein